MRKQLSLLALFVLVGLLGGCAIEPATEEKKESLVDSSSLALQEMKADDAGLDKFLHDSYGYAIFPSVGKGAVGVGGAFGRGVVYEKGDFTGYCSMEQASIGLALGGQEYQELVVFQSKEAAERFKSGSLKFAANASAVAIKSGASAAAKYEDGVAVFSRVKGGLMFEAAIGGQVFKFSPK